MPSLLVRLRLGIVYRRLLSKVTAGVFNVGGRYSIQSVFHINADDVQFEDVILSCDGKAELTKYFAGYAMPEAGEHAFTLNSYVCDASAGAVEWTWHAKHMGKFLGVLAKGKETTIKGVTILTFRGGKVASQHDYWDAVGALKQLGAM